MGPVLGIERASGSESSDDGSMAPKPRQQGPGDASSWAAAVDVELPHFRSWSSALWFTHVQAVFNLRRIASRRVICLPVASTLPSGVAGDSLVLPLLDTTETSSHARRCRMPRALGELCPICRWLEYAVGGLRRHRFDTDTCCRHAGHSSKEAVELML